MASSTAPFRAPAQKLVVPSSFDKFPKFLLDLGVNFFQEPVSDKLPLKQAWGWKIIDVEEFVADPNNKAELEKHGYGAISYGWGPYWPWGSTQESYPIEKERRLKPEFANSAGLQWSFPLILNYTTASGINNGNEKHHLDFDQVRLVFKTIGKRFVWWDHACIPQYPGKGSVEAAIKQLTDERRKAGNNTPVTDADLPLLLQDLSPTLKAVRGLEVGKQKYVYENADVGAVWIHQIVWSTDRNFAIQKILANASYSDTAAGFEAVQDELLKFSSLSAPIEGTARALLLKVLKDPKNTAELKASISNFLANLTIIKNEEYWFQSIWCFQEGRLLKRQALLDYEAKLLGVDNLAGKGVDPLPLVPGPYNKVQANATSSKTKGNRTIDAPSYLHLTACTTLLAGFINESLKKQGGKCPIDFVDLANTDRSFLENSLVSLKNSGLMFYQEGAILDVLASARHSRTFSRFQHDLYYGLEGVLGLDGTFLKPDYTIPDSRMIEVARQFFKQLVYQFDWRVVLLAKADGSDPMNMNEWAAVSRGFYEPVADQLPELKFPPKNANNPTLIYNDTQADGNKLVIVQPSSPASKGILTWKPSQKPTVSAILYKLGQFPQPINPGNSGTILNSAVVDHQEISSWAATDRLIPIQRTGVDTRTEKAPDAFDFSGFGTSCSALCLYLKAWDDTTKAGQYSGWVRLTNMPVKELQDAYITQENVNMLWN
jgi:hypothetical protein